MNADPEAQSFLMNILVVIILTVINAFFASAELAYVSINRQKIENMADEGDKKKRNEC